MQPTPLHIFRNEADGLECRVYTKNDQGDHPVVLFDVDSGHSIVGVRHDPDLERAIRTAKAWAAGEAPQGTTAPAW